MFYSFSLIHSVKRIYFFFVQTISSFSMLMFRNRHRGCASVRREWFSTWSRTSRPHYSSKALWSSGQPGWRMWSLRCSSLTSTGPASRGQLDSSCSSGPSIGLQKTVVQRCVSECIALFGKERKKPREWFFMSPQFHGNQGLDPAQCCQLWFLPPDSPAV